LPKSLRFSRLLAAGLALFFLSALPRSAGAQSSALTLTISAPSGLASWNAVTDPSSGTATITYYLYQKFGIGVNPVTASTPTATEFTSLGIGNTASGRLDGSYCFAVSAVSNEGNGIFVILGYSATVCHSYLHNSAGGNAAGVSRAGDAAGQQVGYGDTWNYTFAMDDDANVTMQVYPPGTTFSSNSVTGLITPNGSPTPTKTIYNSASLSGEGGNASYLIGGGGIGSNTNPPPFWDGTNQSGVIQSNGLYFLYVSVTNPLLNPTLTYSGVTTIPLDYRFTSFATTGISPTVATANVNYNITANSSVRAVIAMPGRQFTIDSSSNVQATNNGVIDTSTNSVVAVIQGQVNYGANTMTWNGLNTLGVAVTTGVYAVGLSAMDGAGNPALNTSGFNGPLTGSIAVDRIPPQTTSSGTAPSVAGITIGGTALNLSGGSQVTAFGTINITLSATGGNGTTVTLTGPNGPIVGGQIAVSGTAVTYSTGVVISTIGAYAVTINPVDPTGNYPGPQQVTNFTVIATPGPSVSSVTLSGNVLTLGGGSTVGTAAPFAPAFVINLNAAAGTNTTATLTGPSGLLAGGVLSGLPGTALTYTFPAIAFSTAGSYSLVIHPIDATNVNVGPVQNIAFTVTAGSSGLPGTGSNGTFAATAVAFPNPVKTPPATIQFTLGLASTVTVDIFTLTGQRVLHQVQQYPASASPQSFLWQMTNDAGNSVASGIYLVHVTAASAQGSTQFKKKILVVR
jgi:flagellar hook assembly protein FlgD